MSKKLLEDSSGKKRKVPSELDGLQMDDDEFALLGLNEVNYEPNARIKALADSGSTLAVDINIPPRRYYRSGLEMVRMANVYMQEGNLENAYVLYMKFMTLFLEKIRKHPDFSSVSVVDRAQNDEKIREVLPKAEKLKATILRNYHKEYKSILERKAKLKLEYEEKIKLQKAKEEERIEINKGNSAYNVPAAAPPRNSSGSSSIPGVDRSTKPASLLSPLLHSRHRLREIIVPIRLMSKFLNLASRNTELNVETCGVLAGRLQRDQLLISHLVVPKQSGTPDSCTTESEEEIFCYQDTHDLITLGWIHTHPSQTCFLSSVDLHTHCAYQTMMPEALAIVCAPTQPTSEQCSYYSLTPDGLSYIANCRLSGFHPHPTEPPIYTKAEHVILQDLSVEVVDLRIR